MSDIDHAEWLNGPEMPPCADCDSPTSREDEYGLSLCQSCADARDEATWERQQAARLADGGRTPSTHAERMDDAYQTDRRLR